MPIKLPCVTKETLTKLYYEDGLSQTEIGELYGVSQVTVGVWMRNLSVPSRWTGFIPDKSLMRILYDNKQLSITEIASRLNVGIDKIIRLMDQYEIELRVVEPCKRCIEEGFSQEELDVIMGSVLGDGSFTKSGNNYYFIVSHNDPQGEYLYWKYDIVRRLCKKEPIVRTDRYVRKDGSHPIRYKFWTRSDPKITKLAGVVYEGSVKKIKEELYPYITPRSLAVWVMDDGHNAGSSFINIMTMAHSRDEVILAAEMISNKFGLKGVKASPRVDNGKTSYVLAFPRHSGLVDLIIPYMHKDLMYKVLS